MDCKVEDLKPGQVLWFESWLETVDRNVKEDDIHMPVIWCATIKELELTSFTKGYLFHGKLVPDIRQFTVHFEEGGQTMQLYEGEKEYLNPNFWLDKDQLIADIREEKEQNLLEAAERLRQAERDYDRYKAILEADIPIVSKAASEVGFRYKTVLDAQAKIDAEPATA